MSRYLFRAALLLSCATAASLLGGCDRSADAPERPGERAPTPIVATKKALIDNEPAIHLIAAARCEREVRCANVGMSKRWASAEACRGDLLAKNRGGLKASECPGGIVQKELDECLEEIRNEDCGNPLDTLGRLAACRSSDLCKALP